MLIGTIYTELLSEKNVRTGGHYSIFLLQFQYYNNWVIIKVKMKVQVVTTYFTYVNIYTHANLSLLFRWVTWTLTGGFQQHRRNKYEIIDK